MQCVPQFDNIHYTCAYIESSLRVYEGLYGKLKNEKYSPYTSEILCQHQKIKITLKGKPKLREWKWT